MNTGKTVVEVAKKAENVDHDGETFALDGPAHEVTHAVRPPRHRRRGRRRVWAPLRRAQAQLFADPDQPFSRKGARRKDAKERKDGTGYEGREEGQTGRKDMKEEYDGRKVSQSGRKVIQEGRQNGWTDGRTDRQVG